VSIASAKHPKPRRGREKLSIPGLKTEFDRSEALRVISMVCIGIVGLWIIVALFSPGVHYRMEASPSIPLDSQNYERELEALCGGTIRPGNQIQVLTNGENFYAAELETLRQARQSINIEAYIFRRGEVAHRILEVLTERARAGVRVHLLIDALGSASTPKQYFKDLRAAGGKVEWYHPVRWNTWFRSNNRTHRELMVVDGRMGFIGGAGIDDQWLVTKPKHQRWRDTVLRVEGNAALGLQSTFVENWLESSGEILSGQENFSSEPGQDGKSPAMVVTSSPSSGGSTRARILMQTLVASAKRSIAITTPYFLPDTGLRNALVDAVRRGVQIRILVPGEHNDHLLTRYSSRGLYGDLLKAGAHVYEYRPTMIHAKILIVDDTWAVAGSTNFDNRSFGINDEVNIAVLDPQIAARLTADFMNDLGQSEEITLEKWKHRPMYQRVIEWVGSLLERQQ